MGMFIIFGFLIALAIFAYVKSNYKKSSNVICTKCGFSGKMRSKPRGSGAVELLLWLCFLLPGLIYSAWRGGKKIYTCPSCSSNDIIPLDSPAGKKLSDTFKEQS